MLSEVAMLVKVRHDYRMSDRAWRGHTRVRGGEMGVGDLIQRMHRNIQSQKHLLALI
jgi:hypothetical protein